MNPLDALWTPWAALAEAALVAWILATDTRGPGDGTAEAAMPITDEGDDTMIVSNETDAAGVA